MIAEADAVERTEREDWLAWRRAGVGASDAAGVVGISPWSTPISVWLDKVGLAGDLEPTEAMRWGTRLEPIVIEAFQEATGLWVVARAAQVTHPTHDWMRATLDGLVLYGDGPAAPEQWVVAGSDKGRALAVYEGKTSGDWNRGWDEGVPEHYQLQVQHQMAITGLPAAYVVALLGGQRMVTYVLERDQMAIDLLMSLEDTFWRRYVLPRIPPPVDGTERTTEAIKAAFAQAAADQVELDDADLELVRQVSVAATEEKEAKERGDLWKNSLRLRLGNAEVGIYQDQPLVTWKQNTVNRLDVDALRAEEPAMAARFTKASIERRLLFPKRKEYMR